MSILKQKCFIKKNKVVSHLYGALADYRNGEYSLIENINFNFSGSCASGTSEISVGKIYLPSIKDLVSGSNIYVRIIANLNTSGANKAQCQIAEIVTAEASIYAGTNYIQPAKSDYVQISDVTGGWVDVMLINNTTTSSGIAYINGLTVSLYKKI